MSASVLKARLEKIRKASSIARMNRNKSISVDGNNDDDPRETFRFDATLMVVGKHCGFSEDDFRLARTQWVLDEYRESAVCWLDEYIKEYGLGQELGKTLDAMVLDSAMMIGESSEKSADFINRRLAGIAHEESDGLWILRQVDKAPASRRREILQEYSRIYIEGEAGGRRLANLAIQDMVEAICAQNGATKASCPTSSITLPKDISDASKLPAKPVSVLTMAVAPEATEGGITKEPCQHAQVKRRMRI